MTTLENYKQIQSSINELKNKLHEINQQKEHWFKKKEDLKKEINELIKEIKEIKSEKDKKNLELHELKKQRNMYNDQVHDLIKRIKKLNKEKAKTLKKYNIKVDPANIQEKINKLEKKVEIEVNFEKEKKLMDEIRKLKKSYDESSELREIGEKAVNIDKEIKEARKKADEFHKKIQDITKDSTYDNFMELSKKITELKKVQEEAFQKFIDHKNDYSKLNQELKTKLDELMKVKDEINKDKELQRRIHEDKTRKILRENSREVEEKLKTKKKLTTEDLLKYQGTEE